MESKTEDKKFEHEYGIHVPKPGTKDDAYQEDCFGNFRIMVRGEDSNWVEKPDGIASLKIDGDLFIGVSPHWENILPSKCVLKVQKADENGDTDFYEFIIVNLCQDFILDSIMVEDLLRENELYVEGDYSFNVKPSKREGFVKIKIVELAALGRYESDKTLNEEEVTDFLIDTFDSCSYDVIDTRENKIN